MTKLAEQLLATTSFDDAWQLCVGEHATHRSIAWRYVEEMTRGMNGFGDMASVPLEKWPLMSISVFRERLMSITDTPDMIFRSSGTSSSVSSQHAMGSLALYHRASVEGFMTHYREAFLHGARFIGYVPGYIDNPASSLLSMMGAIVSELEDVATMISAPQELQITLQEDASSPVVLFGAAFGLVDFVDGMEEGMSIGGAGESTKGHAPMRLPQGSIIIETGGMKTHRRELSREVLHHRLSEGFGVPRSQIHSEYGMCEMTSQAYSMDGVWFTPTRLARFVVKDVNHPLQSTPHGSVGRLGVMDAGNINSCPWFLTDDLAIQREDGAIQVLGRREKSVARGCNYMVDVDG